jgi:hypothetical protein
VSQIVEPNLGEPSALENGVECLRDIGVIERRSYACRKDEIAVLPSISGRFALGSLLIPMLSQELGGTWRRHEQTGVRESACPFPS